MKPFNLEAFKAGKPAVTRDGKTVRYLGQIKHDIYPIVAAIIYHNGDEVSHGYNCDGTWAPEASPYDLFMPSEKKESWLVLPKLQLEKQGGPDFWFKSMDDAEAHRNSMCHPEIYQVAHITWGE